MTADEALALVRHAFRRDAWREINQQRFINDHWGPYCWGYDTRDRVDRGMLLEERGPAFLDLSHVHTPADRIAFMGYERPGGCIGHVAGLARVNFG